MKNRILPFLRGVNKSITSEDCIYIKKFLKEGGVTPLSARTSYEDEIEFIASVQRSVLRIAKAHKILPKDRNREPKDVYSAKGGACFDRSRVIEKIFRKTGFKTRHVFILYPTDKLKSFVDKRESIDSHAATEVRTKKGWLFVDPNAPFRLLDKLKNPYSLENPFPLENLHPVVLKETNEPRFKNRGCMKDILEGPYIFLYGLYSRHGRFYPPFASPSRRIPDVNWTELFLYSKLKVLALLYYYWHSKKLGCSPV
ncbi:MAG: hypothetical protein HWN69_06435 [Desulfobacterales bacterium]|nr:hypothetical protein [Desulfobacterales bacterium]